MPSYEFEGIRPVVDPSAFVHPTAVLIGDVIIGANCLVGPCAVMRGDIGRLIMKEGSNLQDACVVHSFPGDDTVIEEDGHIGHGAVLHGCTIKRNAMVGMNAVVMDGAVIGENSFVAAMAFVKAGMEVPPNVLVSGCPAKVSKELSEEEIAWKSKGTKLYQLLAARHAETEKECEPLTEVEPDRPRVPLTRHSPKHELE
ncbi:MAG TPA: phenylacetic acid degradation protein PaaY [Phycisphaerales bacterium]|nr:phenylacetic acid degradation protein PaaY [Phycisphaerales bacterium]